MENNNIQTKVNRIGKAGRIVSIILIVLLGIGAFGLLIGGILGECLGLLFGQLGQLMNAGGYDNIVRTFFVSSFDLNIGTGKGESPIMLDLYMVKLALGFGIKFNIVSIIGMIISIYIMKWSGDR